MLLPTKSSMFLLDVLSCQPIKLIKVVYTEIIGSNAFHWCNFHSKKSRNIFLMQMLWTNNSLSHAFFHIILSLMAKNSCVFGSCGLKTHTSWAGCQNDMNIDGNIAETRVMILKKHKVITSIFMPFWRRNNLDKLDWLTPQDIYYLLLDYENKVVYKFKYVCLFSKDFEDCKILSKTDSVLVNLARKKQTISWNRYRKVMGQS